MWGNYGSGWRVFHSLWCGLQGVVVSLMTAGGIDLHHNEPPLLGPTDSEGTGHMLRLRERERDIEENKMKRQREGGR